MRNLAKLAAAAALGVGATLIAAAASAAPVYMRSTVGAPWGQTTNESAMDAVFGAGVWNDLRYETANAATVFSATNSFVFMEGSDLNADQLETFLGANIGTIQAWVSSGGRLLLNAAPNEGDGMSFGFGVTLTYPDFGGAGTATAVNPSHPIFIGPFTPVATAYSGSFFSHAHVSGAGLSRILIDGTGDIVLGEMVFGSGLALFGGMTVDFYHDPQPQAHNLLQNIIAYANQGVVVANVPEPITLSLLGAGLAGIGMARRRRG